MTCDDGEGSIGAKPEILRGSGFRGGDRYIPQDSNHYPWLHESLCLRTSEVANFKRRRQTKDRNRYWSAFEQAA
jgi:hypothetical protein